MEGQKPYQAEGSDPGDIALQKIPQVVITPEQKELIKKTIAVGATDLELELFIYDNVRRGVHPLDRMIHFTKRSDGQGNARYTPIVGIDYLRSRADRTGQYAGSDDYVFTGSVEKEDLAATATVYRFMGSERIPFPATVRWKEYYPGEKMGFMWRKFPHNQLGKCAEALALRKAFPQPLGGLHTEEEMHQAENEAQAFTEPRRKSEAQAPPQTQEPPKKENGGKVYEQTESHTKLWDTIMEMMGEEMTEAANVLDTLTTWIGEDGVVHPGKRDIKHISEKAAQVAYGKLTKGKKKEEKPSIDKRL